LIEPSNSTPPGAATRPDFSKNLHFGVIPANAEIHVDFGLESKRHWVPAFAGMMNKNPRSQFLRSHRHVGQ